MLLSGRLCWHCAPISGGGAYPPFTALDDGSSFSYGSSSFSIVSYENSTILLN